MGKKAYSCHLSDALQFQFQPLVKAKLSSCHDKRAPTIHSAEWAGHGHVVLKAVPGDTVLQNFNVCLLTESLRFCLPRR